MEVDGTGSIIEVALEGVTPVESDLVLIFVYEEGDI